MCKELEERLTEENIDLGSNSFVELSQNANTSQFVKLGYIQLQSYYYMLTGSLIPDNLAIAVVNNTFVEYKNAGLLDILNRRKQL